jgi:hypothetical protein
MALLQAASVEQLRRLLEFFPAATLKAEWPGTKGQKKPDACEIIAKTKDVERIKSFVLAHFAHCRQHVLLLGKPENEADILAAFPPVDTLGTLSGGTTIYLSSVPYSVYLLNPMEEVNIDVLWPIRVDVKDKIIVVRTVVLERDPPNYSGRDCIKSVRKLDEKKIVQDLSALTFLPLDINKGVKALWSSKYMDAFRSSFKKANSTQTEVMDGEIGLRENAPDVFNELTSKPLLNTYFRTDASIENSLGIFQINATLGRIGFTSFTENPGDSDAIIEAILKGNS